MKKIFFAFLLSSIVSLYAQTVFDDAIYISKEAKKKFDDIEHLDSLAIVMSRYLPPDQIDKNNSTKTIDTLINNNIFFKGYFQKEKTGNTNKGTPFELGAKRVLSSVGGLNVANAADGLAKFLVERTKQELSVFFFQKFQEDLEKSEELKALFPASCKVLKTIGNDIYMFDAYLNTLREAFIKDMMNFYNGFDNLCKMEKYRKLIDDNPELTTIVKNAIYFSNQYALGIHPGKVLASYEAEKMIHLSNSNLTWNLQKSIRISQIFSESLRSSKSDTYWVSYAEVQTQMQDPVFRSIYVGLLYQQILNEKIIFKKDAAEVDVAAEIKKAKETIDPYINYIRRLAADAERIDKNLILLSSTSSEPDFNNYYEVYDASITLLEDGLLFVGLPGIDIPDETKLVYESKRIFTIARNFGELSLDVKTKNYSSAVLNAIVIMDSLGIGNDNENLKKNILKYGTFAANVSQAKNSDEVKAAIEAIALPVGSSTIKRNTTFNVSLNAFVGLSAGTESKGEEILENKKLYTGLTAPVGIYFGWGNKLKCRPFDKCRKAIDKRKPISAIGGKSLGVFISLVDVGSLVSYRFEDTTALSSEIRLENIVAPGLHLHLGLGKCPISLMLGAQMAPPLRSVTTSGLTIEKDLYVRFGGTISVDLPLLNLYTKTHSTRKKN